MQRTRPRLSYANVVATLALFIALGGTVYAAGKINGKSIKRASIPGNRLKPNGVTGKQVKESTLTVVPSSTYADHTSHAAAADNATHASSSDLAANALNSDLASNALQLAGTDPVPDAMPMDLLNGWVPYGQGYDQAAYWKDAFGEVHLKGSVRQPVPGSDVIFVLPVGWRPARSTNWPATLDSATFGTIEIEADGSVRSRTFSSGQATQSRLFTSMEGVSFRPTDP